MTVPPGFFLSESNSCVEILPATIGMAFGTSERNNQAGIVGILCERPNKE